MGQRNGVWATASLVVVVAGEWQVEESRQHRVERVRRGVGQTYDAAAFEQSAQALYRGRLEVVLHHCLAAPKRELRLMTIKVRARRPRFPSLPEELEHGY
jgi:hypothetical protein